MNLDFFAILKIIGIDIMLGVDNALVIAMACASLPVALRGRAVLLGTAGAIALRIGFLAIATYLFGMPYVKLIAGAYLVYIGYKLLVEHDDEPNIPASDRMVAAVKTIIVADAMMSLDNVLAVVSASQSAGEHSFIYAVAGILFSIPIIIAGAQGIMKLMDRFPIIIWLGGGLLGWIGVEMLISDPLLSEVMNSGLPHSLFEAAGFLVVILAAGLRKLVEPELIEEV